MDLEIGGNAFHNVIVPVLWGTRAVLQDSEGRLSVIDLRGDKAVLEIVGDKPAPNIEYVPMSGDVYEIMRDGKPVYMYTPHGRILWSTELELPSLEIGDDEVRVGSNVFRGSTVSGSEVGIAVTEQGSTMACPLPERLGDLIVEW
jgi:hypothetical protein